MRTAAFDLEIARETPATGRWQDAAPLGVTCAALSLSDQSEPVVWQGVPELSSMDCQDLIKALQAFVDEVYTLITWNGCGFDFAELAIETNMPRECARLALHHVDLMLLVTFTRGWYLSLEKALKGAGLDGKLKSVTLSDGTRLDEMRGSLAPALWAQGEFEAVLAYLRRDVEQMNKLVSFVRKNRIIRYYRGRFCLAERERRRVLRLGSDRLLAILDG